MTAVIRRASLADAESLGELAVRTFCDTFAADNTPEDVAAYLESAYTVTQLARDLADPAITTLVADADGALVAFAQLRAGAAPDCVRGPAPIELWRFYVAKEWHGRGLAQRLMDEVIATALRANTATLWLGVWEHNARAIAYYRKAGYTDVGAQVFMLGSDRQTDRVMMRPISPASHA